MGDAIDEGETELGVRCGAVAFRAPLLHAVSVSGPAGRMTEERVRRAVAALEGAVEQLRAELDDRQGSVTTI